MQGYPREGLPQHITFVIYRCILSLTPEVMRNTTEYSFSKPSRFEHQPLVNRSLFELHRGLGAECISRFQNDFSLPNVEDVWLSPIVCAGLLVRHIVKHFQLPRVAVVVDHNDALSVPGRVTLSDSDDLFVEIRKDVNMPNALAALLAHEVAHIFLHRHKIGFEDTFENEVLTDTTAAFLGCGATMLAGVTRTSQWVEGGFLQNPFSYDKLSYFGYVPLNAIGYVIAKREELLKKPCVAGVELEESLAAVRTGRAFVASERARRPFTPRSFLDRARVQLAGGQGTPLQRGYNIEFDCPICSQILRIPRALQQMTVRCKTCGSRFPCYLIFLRKRGRGSRGFR